MPRVKQGDDAKLPLSSRVSPEFMALLQAAAKQAGRSVSQEVEHRLLASFASETPSLTAEDVRQIVREEMGRVGAHAPVPGLSERTVTSGAHSHSLTIASDQSQGPVTCVPAPGWPSFAGIQAGQEPRRVNLGAYYAGQGLWLNGDGSPVFPEDA